MVWRGEKGSTKQLVGGRVVVVNLQIPYEEEVRAYGRTERCDGLYSNASRSVKT